MFKIFAIISIFAVAINLSHCQNYDDQVKFEFFYGTAVFPQMEIFNVETLETIVNHQGFRAYAPTVVFHFDAGESSRDQRVLEVVTSYLYVGNYNVILVDYQNVGVISDSAADELGASISRGIIGFLKRHDPDDVRFLGNGVGAHVMSVAADNLRQNGFFITRVTGLNPTRILHSALFVDTIHTEETNYGPKSVGHVAFFVNGGTHPQPGCISLVSCSNDLGKRVWAESVREITPSFPCLPCHSWQAFLNNECNENQPIGNMGIHAQSFLRGSYFVQTNTREPWSRQTPLPN